MSATLAQNGQASASNAWDFPASFAGLNDGDFLAMLEKQVNAHPLTTQSYTLTPPLSEEDSSPSPTHSELERTNTNTPDEGNHKRKVSPDDDDDLDDEAPERKSSNRTGSVDTLDSRRSNRRKSSGGQKDEGRLMKRKEQNRAAQRAFRERKEKHVKDLEERVAVLESEKADTQNENENLKDLLNRLQTENQLLKQGQFTFSMPSAGKKRSSTDGSTDSSPEASSSSGQEPVFSNTSPPLDTFSNPLFNLNTTLTTEPSLTSSSDTNLSMFGSFPVTPTWTTLATAPQYTSYRDPVYDRIFGGAGDISPYATRGDEGEEGGLVNLEELFGEDFGDLMPIVGDFSPAAEAVLPQIDTQMKDDSAATAASLPQVDGAHHPQHHEGQHGYTPCPSTKEGVARLIASGGGEQTFGPPLDTINQFVPAPTAVPGPVDPIQAQLEEEICPFADFRTNESFMKVDPNVPSLPIGEAWKQVKSNPAFEDCDIDELCSLLKEQARCSGGKPVIEETNFNGILTKMGGHRGN